MSLAGDIALILIAAMAAGVLARQAGLPLIVGYMVAGIAIGPHTPGPTVAKVKEIEILSDVGVALLLFTLGLHFPARKLAPVWRVALVGTPLQLAATAALGYGMAAVMGMGWREAIWFGALVALSSTTVVLKSLVDQGVVNTLASRVMTGILIIQDLAMAPLLILLPTVTGLPSGPQGTLPAPTGTNELTGPHMDPNGMAGQGLAGALLRAAVLTAGMALIGTKAIPRLLSLVVRWKSRELFLLAVAALALGVGYTSYLMGLPFAFGAFLAGMVLSQSEYSHQALHDITPLRDLFTILFFVTMGMLLDPSFFIKNTGTIAVLVTSLLVTKGLILAGITYVFGYRNIVPIVAGMGLFQVGEFSFVLARFGNSLGVLSPRTYSLALSVALVSMALTPFTLRAAAHVYRWWRTLRPAAPIEPPPPSPAKGVARPAPLTEGPGEHVVIAGYGRIGRFVARLLHQIGKPFTVIDMDDTAVADAQREGFPVVYGDAAASTVLEAAGVRRSRLVILTLPDALSTRLAVENTRRLNPSVHIVARSAAAEQIDELARLGVYEAVQPEFEAALELAHQALAHLGIGAEEIQEFSNQIRHEFYAPIINEPRVPKDRPSPAPAAFPAARDLLPRLRQTARLIQTEWVRIPEGSPLAGRAIGEARVRELTGASVVAIVRGESVIPNPGPSIVFTGGDMVGVIGAPEQRAAFRALAHGVPMV